MTGAGGPRPLVTAAADAPAYWSRDALWSVLLSGEDTVGQFTLLEQLTMLNEPDTDAAVHDKIISRRECDCVIHIWSRAVLSGRLILAQPRVAKAQHDEHHLRLRRT